MSTLKEEISRRRTFAIISHPDAGTTTLTEKFLLYGGAIAGVALKERRIVAKRASEIAPGQEHRTRRSARIVEQRQLLKPLDPHVFLLSSHRLFNSARHATSNGYSSCAAFSCRLSAFFRALQPSRFCRSQ